MEYSNRENHSQKQSRMKEDIETKIKQNKQNINKKNTIYNSH